MADVQPSGAVCQSNLAESNVIDGAFLQRADSADNAGAEQLLHHQEADQTGQTGSAVVVVIRCIAQPISLNSPNIRNGISGIIAV